MKNVSLVSLLTLLMVLPMAAQKSTGDIRGTISDVSGAVVTDATVTATQAGTEFVRTANTNNDGAFAITDVPAGTYKVVVTKAGFKEAVTNNVVVNVSTATTANSTLVVGGSGEQVTVEANSIQVETSTGAVSGVVDGQQVRELPLNGRSFVQLTQLQPGVSPANNFDSKNKGLLSGVDFSVNGNTTTSNLFLIDGANDNDTGSNRTILIYPSIEAIQEFKMLRNSYGPEYGQASGAVVNLVTRGGTNDFHGSAFYFGRNDALNATEYFARRGAVDAATQGKPLPNNGKDKLRRNDYGFSLGGPVWKDHVFFFYSEEWNKEIRGITRFGRVPTMAERSGDFSQPVQKVGNTLCNGYDNGQAIAAGNPGFATQVIPAGNLSPGGLLMAKLYPVPNISSTTSCDNWHVSTPASLDFREENARVDFKLTKSNTIFARYTQDHWQNPYPILFNAGLWGDDAFPAVESSWSQPSKQAAVKWSSVLGSSAVNEVQFSYSANSIAISPGGTDPTLNSKIDAAIPSFYPESGKLNKGNRSHPVFWGGIAPYGNNVSGADLWNSAPWKNNLDIYSARDDFSKVWGNHTFKVGFLDEWAAKNENTGGSSASETPQFWGGGSTAGWGSTPNFINNNSGLANVLTSGQHFGFNEQSTEPVANTRYKNIETYFGDTWKARRNLTLEYGFRWSFLREPYDDKNGVASWDPKLFDPAKGGDACNGVVVVPGTDPCTSRGFMKGTPGVNRSLRHNNNHLIAPRLGLAWQPFSDGKTVLRAGLGQFFQRERINALLNLAANAPFAIVNSGFRELDTVVQSDPNNVSTFGAGGPSLALAPRGVTPNSWQWNVTLEQELYPNSKLELSYVGNRTMHLTSTNDINQVPIANRLQAATCANPCNINTLRPATPFGTITLFSRNGDANYNSLQALFRTKIMKRSELQAAYTWSKSISDVGLDESGGTGSGNQVSANENSRLDRGPSAINRPHIFVANYVWYLPDFKDRNGFMKSTLGGWEWTSIINLSSGSSMTPFEGGNGFTNIPGGVWGTGYTNNIRPLRVAGVPCHVSTPGHPEQIINPAAFTAVGQTLGVVNGGGRGACLGPGTTNIDTSFHKNWLTAHERLTVQLRLELFNALNHANFNGSNLQGSHLALYTGNGTAFCGGANACGAAGAGNTITSVAPGTQRGDFGSVGATRGAREIQYALKFIF